MHPLVSIIVPAKNEEKVIGNCIDSLLKLDYPKNKMEIIIAVDGSTDRTVEICKGYGKKIRLIVSSPKRCKAEALNDVLPRARGDIIGIYDADCIVGKNCLKLAMRHFEDKDVAGVSCALRSSNRRQNLLTWALSMETCFISYVEHFLSLRGSNSMFFGRNMFIRKSVLDKIGLFDCDTYQEDGVLNMMMRRSGYRIDFESRAIAWNEEPSTLKSFINQRIRWTRGFWRTMKKFPYRNSGYLFSDFGHGLYYYTTPFFLMALSSVMLLSWLKMSLYLAIPFVSMFMFNMYLLVKSMRYYREPLSGLIILPLFLFLGGLISAVFIKSFFDEVGNKEMKWFKAERTGVRLK